MNYALNFLDYTIVKLVIIVSFAVTIFIIFNPISTLGGELLFLLPLTLLICAIIFPKLILYQKKGWGLKIFYIVILVRYLLVPYLICVQGHFSIGGIPAYALTHYSHPESYFYAIISMILELLTSLFVINMYYDITYSNILLREQTKRGFYPSLKMVGIILTLFFLYLIVVRGGIQNFIRIGIVTEDLDYDSQAGHHGIDVDIIKPLMGFLVITVTSSFRKLSGNNSLLSFVVPMAIAIFSCVLIVGNNRMQMVYLALCSIAVLSKAFPDYRRRIYSIIFPILGVILVSFTFIKQFDVSVATGDLNNFDNKDAIVGLTEYVCGPENTAHTYDNYLKRGMDDTPKTIITDILKYNYCLRLPILSELKTPVLNNKTIIDYAVDRSEMISVAGQCAFYGHGMIGGWLLDILSFFFIVRLLIFFEIKSKVAENLGIIYIYNWCAILFGVSMCYCLITLWYNITYVPVWIWVLLKLNDLGRK